MHQGYIEPQGCVASYSEDGQIELWCCTQGTHVFRDRLSAILKTDSSKDPRDSNLKWVAGLAARPDSMPEPVSQSCWPRRRIAPVKDRADTQRSLPRDGSGGCQQDAHQDGLPPRTARSPPRKLNLMFQSGAFTGLNAHANASQRDVHPLRAWITSRRCPTRWSPTVRKVNAFPGALCATGRVRC